MKRFKLLLATLVFLGSLAIVPQGTEAASPFAVTVSTVIPNGSVNGSTAFTAAGYPQIATSNVRVRKLWVSNDGAAERVSLWKNCTSSTTAVMVWDGIVPSSTTATAVAGNLEIDILPNDAVISNVCIHKGLNGSGTVKASFFYE